MSRMYCKLQVNSNMPSELLHAVDENNDVRSNFSPKNHTISNLLNQQIYLEYVSWLSKQHWDYLAALIQPFRKPRGFKITDFPTSLQVQVFIQATPPHINSSRIILFEILFLLPPDHASRLSLMSEVPCHRLHTAEECLHWPSQQSERRKQTHCNNQKKRERLRHPEQKMCFHVHWKTKGKLKKAATIPAPFPHSMLLIADLYMILLG